MITAKLIGWEKGLRTVSLINVIREQGGVTLPQAKAMVESLLAGQTVTLKFIDAAKKEAFLRAAVSFGAKCE